MIGAPESKLRSTCAGFRDIRTLTHVPGCLGPPAKKMGDRHRQKNEDRKSESSDHSVSESIVHRNLLRELRQDHQSSLKARIQKEASSRSPVIWNTLVC